MLLHHVDNIPYNSLKRYSSVMTICWHRVRMLFKWIIWNNKNRFAYPADNFTTTSNQGLGRWVLQFVLQLTPDITLIKTTYLLTYFFVLQLTPDVTLIKTTYLLTYLLCVATYPWCHFNKNNLLTYLLVCVATYPDVIRTVELLDLIYTTIDWPLQTPNLKVRGVCCKRAWN